MEQTVKVRKINPDGTAEVEYARVSACSGNCRECRGCSEADPQMVRVTARNAIGAKVGDRVVVSSDTGQVLSAVAVVYLLPLVLLIVGCIIQGLALGLVGLAAGFLAAIALDRYRSKKKKITFTISAYAQQN